MVMMTWTMLGETGDGADRILCLECNFGDAKRLPISSDGIHELNHHLRNVSCICGSDITCLQS